MAVRNRTVYVIVRLAHAVIEDGEICSIIKLYILIIITIYLRVHWGVSGAIWAAKQDRQLGKDLSEVGFEPTPGEPDCDLNAAP